MRRIQKINEATPEPPVETKRVLGPRSMAKAIKKAKLDQTVAELNTTTKSKSEIKDESTAIVESSVVEENVSISK